MVNSKADISLIKDYLNGKLDARAMYELERRAQDDPELMDLMLGMEVGNVLDDEQNLLVIDQLIKQRVDGGKTKTMIPWGRWAVAASFFLCVSITAFLLLKQPEQTLIKSNSEQVQQTKRRESITTTDKNVVAKNQGASVLNNAAMDSIQKTSVKNSIVMSTPKFSKVKPAAEISEEVINPSILKSRAKAVELPVLDARKDTAIHAANTLSEVAIVGYGTQKKQSLTASATTITNAQPVSADLMLAGKVAGVNIEHAQSRAKKSFVVKGIVTDADGNTPLPGVAIRLRSENKGTSTDANGKFSIEVPKNGETLQASMIGFDQKIFKVNLSQDSLNIVLRPSTDALSEVVVVGYGVKKAKLKMQKAQPALGWDAFNKYLKENATVEDGKGGKVTLAFTVDQNGAITGIRVRKSSGIPVMDIKATELILNGPKWIGDSDGHSKEITLKIRFH